MIKNAPKITVDAEYLLQWMQSVNSSLQRIFSQEDGSKQPAFQKAIPCQISEAGITLTNKFTGRGVKYHDNFIEGQVGISGKPVTHYIPITPTNILTTAATSATDVVIDLSTYTTSKTIAMLVKGNFRSATTSNLNPYLQIHKNGGHATREPDLIVRRATELAAFSSQTTFVECDLTQKIQYDISTDGSETHCEIWLFGYIETTEPQFQTFGGI